ncbi:MAG: hypothetical protein H0X66_17510 [Verrucomicrobia bacterium]|nr:hypothetical protein [Verrucomicrobiota bacterium]
MATLQNSTVPGLATHHFKNSGKALSFTVFLRGKSNDQISKWQQQIVERLFEKSELPTAIQQGMNEYEMQVLEDGFDGDEEEAVWNEIKKNGVLPYVILLALVVDELEREVILSLASDLDGNIEEHGIAISLRRGRWRFHHSDYLAQYCGRVDAEEKEKLWKQRQEIIGTPEWEPSPKTMYGTWVFDDTEAKRLFAELKLPKSEIRRNLKDGKEFRLELSSGRLVWVNSALPGEFELLGFEKLGDIVKIKFQNIPPNRPAKGQMEFKYYNGRLVALNAGLVFRKI